MEYTKEWQEAVKNKDDMFKALNVEVGDRFIVVDNDNQNFKRGDIVTLIHNDDSSAPKFKTEDNYFAYCNWFRLKPLWTPKQGDTIEVWGTNKEDTEKREFIAMSAKGKYLCWDWFRIEAYVWTNAKPIKKKPVHERRWKMLIDNDDGITIETDYYYNQKRIDKDWGDRYKGSFIDVLVKDK